MTTWFASRTGTKNVGTTTSGNDNTGVMPGMAPRSVTPVAVATATTRASRPNAVQAGGRPQPSGVRDSPAGGRTSARTPVAMSPQPARAANTGASPPPAAGTRN